MRFLGDFEKIADYEEMEGRDRLYFFRFCLTGKARDWFDFQEAEDYEEAIAKFRYKYWSRADQNQFRDSLRNGMYKAGTGRTMSEYVEKFARDARFLIPSIPEYELADALSQHFSPEIYEDLLMQRVDTISELCHRLDVVQQRERNRKHRVQAANLP